MKDKKKPLKKPISTGSISNNENQIKNSNMKDSQKVPENQIKNPEINQNINIERQEPEISNNDLNTKLKSGAPIFKNDNSSNKEKVDKVEIHLLKDQIINEKDNNNILEIDDQEYIPNYIGKLCFDPLLLFVYNSKKNSFHAQKFDQILQNLDELNSSSSCCNGDNKLFLFGGINNNGEIMDKLWIFDLVDYSVEDPIVIEKKNNHSMIYIPKNYIFIVGGNDENVFYFDISEKKVEKWDKLNKKRIEPALIQLNHNLYVFDNINKVEDNHNGFELSFEKTDLLSSKPKWELIKPDLSTEIFGTNFIPKFFGVAKESNNDIIFLGGNILNENESLDDIHNYKYDIKNNIIEFSDVPFVNVVLKEKTFLPFNSKNDVFFILPDFYKKCPQVAFFSKNKKLIKIVDYKPNYKNEGKKINELEQNLNINREDLLFKKYSFNMPKKVENEIIEI